MDKNVAIITGVSSGLGLQLANVMARYHDIDVVGVSRSRPRDNEWGQLEILGAVEHVQGDVSDPNTVDTAFVRASQRGQIDYVINCAGQGVFGPVGGYTKCDIDDVLESSLIGTILFSQRAYIGMRSRGGVVINVMSTAARVGRVNESIYCAAKWGARGFTESLRIEAQDTPVDIVAIYPGGMRTSFWSNARGLRRDDALFMDPHDVAREILDVVTSKRRLLVSDIVIKRRS